MAAVAEDKRKEEAKKRREEAMAVALALLLPLTVSFRNRSVLLAHQWAAGSLSAQQFGAQFVRLMPQAHAHAFYAGRVGAGLNEPFSAIDQAMGDLTAVNQSQYVVGFVNDLENGRYGEPIDVREIENGRLPFLEPEKIAEQFPGLKPVSLKQIEDRIDLYAERLRGTANEAVQKVLATENVSWVLDPAVKDHCASCLYMASISGWALADMPFLPGDGSTECGANCKCRIIDSDGVVLSF